MSNLVMYLRLSLEDDVNADESNSITNQRREKSFTAVLMWYQHAYQVTNYVLHKRIFKKSAS